MRPSSQLNLVATALFTGALLDGDLFPRSETQPQRPGGGKRDCTGNIVGHAPVNPGQPRIGRNEPCPCGSGQKYKRCCIDNPVRPEVM